MRGIFSKKSFVRLIRGGPPLALVVLLTLVGFLLVVTGSATSVAARNEEPRKQALISEIMRERRDVDDLDKAVDEVRKQLDSLELQAGLLSASKAELNAQQRALEQAAGALALRGPGVVVKLSDAPKSDGDTDNRFDAGRIHDRDLQLAVNALFAAGAEAIAINDNRVVSITPIRAAGATIVINYRPVSSPYRIVAIGVDKKDFERTDIAKQFKRWEKQFEIGFSIDSGKDLRVPAYSGRTSIRIAEPVIGNQ